MSEVAPGADDKGGTPAVDYNAVYGSLSAENKEAFTRKGFDKAGANGAPADINVIFDWGRNAEKMVGANTLPAPRLDDDKAFSEWKGHELLGVPPTEKDYKFERPKLPDGVQYDEAAENAFRVAAKKAHIGQKQAGVLFNELMALQTGRAAQSMQQQTEAKATMERDLRAAYGASYDANMNRAQMAMRFMAEKAGIIAAGDTPEAVKEKLGVTADGLVAALGNTNAVRLMAFIGGQLSEDQIKGGHDAGFASGPAAAKAQISALKTDAEFMKAYHDARHAGHKDAVQRMNRLHEQAAG